MRRLLIIGLGDVAARALAQLRASYRVYALTHRPEAMRGLRALGVRPLLGNLDDPMSLKRLAGLAHAVLYSAPPPGQGTHDPRTRNLLAALSKAQILPQALVYISTSGVYGDCHGEWVAETRPIAPQNARARRRADAEARLRGWGRANGVRVSILRAPGIYSRDRLPIARLTQATPALRAAEDPYTNHIHADDLARAAIAALARGRPGRVYNVADDSGLRMGEYFDLIADACGLPRPPRISRAEALQRLPETQLSFMRESRRLSNARMKRELKLRLRHPTVAACMGDPYHGRIAHDAVQ
ncbi:MAG: NAD-dependent epimerase/dehydratase family protein [Betaproteobacteria bacterium]|nr:NAD-dependent epimerase/dehydratase family protein [Betaproteobacteria bacterium]